MKGSEVMEMKLNLSIDDIMQIIEYLKEFASQIKDIDKRNKVLSLIQKLKSISF